MNPRVTQLGLVREHEALYLKASNDFFNIKRLTKRAICRNFRQRFGGEIN